MLARYQEKGGKVLMLEADVSPQEAVKRIRGFVPGSLSLAVAGAPYVLGNVTRLGTRKALAIHLLNYAAEPVSGIRVRVNLDREFASLAGAQPRLLTPDPRTSGIAAVRWNGSAIEFALKSLDTYGIVILE